MTAASYDLIVIGAGIHGAGIAQAAAARGHSVLVLEKTAPAAGTSSRSSKLIHGGLRYLESGQLSLVRECLHERTLLLRLAPDLVKRVPFYIPVYPGAKRGPTTLRIGLTLYALLGGLAPDTRFARLSRRQWDTLDGLETRRLRAVYRYFDAQTDDVALTRAVLASAQSIGAEVVCPGRLVHGRVHAEGVEVEYALGNTTQVVRANALVNAAGAWANGVLERFVPAQAQLQVQMVQGTHIIVPGTLTQGIYYVPAPSDQRPVFVMPWKGNVMVGTTEHVYHGDPLHVNPRPDERTYLLEVLSYYFPVYRSESTARIVDAFAGLRVLPMGDGTLGHRPREITLHVDREDKPRLLTLYGGKLTAYRATSQRVIERIAPSLPSRRENARTDALPLTPV